MRYNEVVHPTGNYQTEQRRENRWTRSADRYEYEQLAKTFAPKQVIRNLRMCTCKGGNLLLNIAPAPDGSVPKITDEEIEFEKDGHRIFLKNLPADPPDKTLGVTVIKMEFDKEPRQVFRGCYPQMHEGHDFSGGHHVWAKGEENK